MQLAPRTRRGATAWLTVEAPCLARRTSSGLAWAPAE